MSAYKQLDLPVKDELMGALAARAGRDDAVERCVNAAESGWFIHPDGRSDELGVVVLSPLQLALLSEISVRAPEGLSIDIGFGMGSSATLIMGSRRDAGLPIQHLAFDPYGLPDGRGEVVQSYLESQFGDVFSRIYKRSEIGLAQLFESKGAGCASLVFIDGSHTFENVLVDFMWSDLLVCEGGYIVFDDADYPAIETVVNYVMANRPNYEFAQRHVENTTVLRKTGIYDMPWYAFTPFAVPDRRDWNRGAP